MNDLITDYIVAEGTNERDFRTEVMRHVNNGYVLYGNPFSGNTRDGVLYLFQALVKYI